jgi:mRNA interferase HigB
MFVFGKDIAEKYLDKHEILRPSYLKWIDTVEAATFNTHNELKALYPKADYVGNERYIFDLKGNDYRMIVLTAFVGQTMFIRWIGTHAEYSKLKDCSII